MGQQNKPTERSQHMGKTSIHVNRLHPSLRTKFIALPRPGEALTEEQLSSLFSGDVNALRDVISLVQQQILEDTEK